MTGSFSSKYIKKKSEAAIFINALHVTEYLTPINFTFCQKIFIKMRLYFKHLRIIMRNGKHGTRVNKICTLLWLP